MYLNAIRYKCKADNEPQTWRFHQGMGTLGNVICLGSDTGQISSLQSALIFALTGRSDDKVTECTLHLSDSSGDAWVIERTQEDARILRNGHMVTGDQAQQIMFRAIMDLEHSDSADEALRPLKCLDVSIENDQIVAASSHDDRANRDRMQALNEGLRQNLADDLARVFSQKTFSSPKTVVSLARRIEPVFTHLTELTRIKKDLLGSNSETDSQDGHQLPILRDQIALLDKLHQAAEPLLDPAKSPTQIREKISKIDQQIVELCRACGIKSTKDLQENIPWPKVIELRGRVAFYDKLSELANKASVLAEERVGKVYEEFTDEVSNMLENKSQITSELESCLSSLQIEMQSFENNHKAPLKKAFDAVGSFLKPELKDEELRKAATHSGRLEKARMAVDFALAKLGELSGEIKKSRDQFSVHETSMQERHRKLHDEFKRLLEQWRNLAKTYGITESMELSAILRLSVRHQQLLYLNRRREELVQNFESRRADLQSVEELVYQWRQRTGSHRTDRIANENLLLSEAQGILRYRQQKQEQVLKLEEQAEQSKVQHIIALEIESRLREAQDKWHQAFSICQVPILPFTDRNWPTFFEKSHTIQALSEILHEAKKPLAGAQAFGVAASDTPLTIYQWKMTSLTNKQRLEVMQILEDAPPAALQLHLVRDEALAEMLHKLGAGRANRISNRGASSSPKVVSSANAEVHQSSATNKNGATASSDVPQRARAIMDLFDQAKRQRLR